MKTSDFFKVLLLLLVFIVAYFLFAFILIGCMMVDSLTSQEIGEESVPCIDKNGNPFEDESCTEKVYCSKWGLVTYDKCILVATGEGENK